MVIRFLPKSTKNPPSVGQGQQDFPGFDWPMTQRTMHRCMTKPWCVNLSLRIDWRQPSQFAKRGRVLVCALEASMSPEALNSFFSLLIGFALAGALTSGYQALVDRPAGFGLLTQEAASKAIAAIPFLVFAAPFIIMRNTVRGRQIESRRFEFVMIATILAGIWSLMSGTFVVMLLEATGFFVLNQSANL